MNKSYIFALYVNGKVHKAFNWYCEDDRMMRMQAVALCAGAKAFKSTAGVLVYALCDDNNYHLCHSVDFKASWMIYHVFFSVDLVNSNICLVDMLNTATWRNSEKANVIASVL